MEDLRKTGKSTVKAQKKGKPVSGKNPVSSPIRKSLHNRVSKLTPELLLSVFEGITDGIMVIDRNYKVLACNQSLLSMVNLREKDIVGQNCFRICLNAKDICKDCTADEVFDRDRVTTRVRTCINAASQNRTVEIWNFPIRNKKGDVVKIIEYLKDVTDKQSLKVELDQYKPLALLGELSAKIAHEIRNPINAIEGAAYYLLEGHKKDQELVRYLELIRDQVVRLNQVASDLLGLARPHRADRQPHQIGLLLHGSVMQFFRSRRNLIDKVSVEIAKGPVLEEHIMADRLQFEQMMLNLLTNAADAMPEGGNIRIKSTRENGYFLFSILDSGTGIDEESLRRIEEPFFTTKPGGTGLGLSIINRIAANHDGNVTFKRGPEGGTEVLIQIPSDGAGNKV